MQPEQLRSSVNADGKRVGDFLLKRKIGTGQFGEVWHAVNTSTGRDFAIKVAEKFKIDNYEILKRLLETEINIMHEIDHPNVLHLHEYIETENNYYLVLQFCEKGDFANYIKKNRIKHFTEQQCFGFLIQIANGFNELRRRKIIHRDFKLANILLTGDRLVIGDFGFAKKGYEVTSTRLGTPLTMAPEILDPSVKGKYDCKVDLWAVGVVFYKLLFGRAPFRGKSRAQLLSSIKRYSGSRLRFLRRVSKECRELLIGMLQKDPKRRLSWKQFFNHAFFNKHLKTNKRQPSAHDSQFQDIQRSQFEKVEMNDLEELTKRYKPKKRLRPKRVRGDVVHQNAVKIRVRYHHEKNKIVFIFWTIKKISELMRRNTMSRSNAQFINIQSLVIKKAQILNNMFCESLKYKQNPLRFDKKDFREFLASELYKKMLHEFEKDEQPISEYLELIVTRAKRLAIVLSNQSLISSKEIRLSLLDKKIMENYEAVKKAIKENELKPDEAVLVYQVLLSVKYAANCQKVFPFKTKRGGKRVVYDWRVFYKGFRAMGVAEMKLKV